MDVRPIGQVLYRSLGHNQHPVLTGHHFWTALFRHLLLGKVYINDDAIQSRLKHEVITHGTSSLYAGRGPVPTLLVITSLISTSRTY